MSYGVEQIKKILDLLIEIGNVTPRVIEAKGTISKIGAILPLSDEILGLIKLDVDMLRKEYKDLSELERMELKAYVAQKFDIDDDALELKVEDGLALVNDAIDFIQRISGYAQSFKKE